MSDLGILLAIVGLFVLAGGARFGGAALIAFFGGPTTSPKPTGSLVQAGGTQDGVVRVNEAHPYGCELCGHSFVSEEKLALHTKNFHPEGEARPQTALQSQSDPMQSVELPQPARPDDPTSLPCPRCTYVFASEEKLAAHIRNFHP